jgi:4-hydroxy-tetrahydrodipicolinate synthase
LPNDTHSISGVLSPVVTPFDDSHQPDASRFTQHCQWLLDSGVGLAIFGTNSEANSLSVLEKRKLLDHLAQSGLPTQRMMPGTGACSTTDAIELTRAAVDHGCAGVLMLPPFYYKGVSDEGLFRFYSEVIQQVGDAKLRIYLYHIPPVANVAITFPLIEKLLKAYPGTIAGIKDSSGDWDNTRGMLEQFQPEGFDVFAGSESFLLATLRAGGAGCISATANVNPAAIDQLYQTWQNADADEQQAQLDAVRDQFKHYVMIAALKATLAHHRNDPEWMRVRAPLTEVNNDQQQKLIADLANVGFSMPGIS